MELALLEAATQSTHAYYHLLSGVDFPLRSQDEIHLFFSEREGKQYISFDCCIERMPEFEDRIRFFYPFQNLIGRNVGKHIAFYYYIQCMLLDLQKKIKIDRLKNSKIELSKGSNWFSITHDLALSLLEHRHFIEKYFSCGMCADELFLQTFACSSLFKNDIINDNLRLIDWCRGKPYIFKLDDYEMLVQSKKLFARKFDEKVDMEIVDKILSRIQR